MMVAHRYRTRVRDMRGKLGFVCFSLDVLLIHDSKFSACQHFALVVLHFLICSPSTGDMISS
jgi:hypothetical protein